ncbi:MAG: flagellar protein FlaG [Rhodocyclaceae bacterium]|nr:flagellar protein FlaG [Rhodocyclaceae bacterium]
MAAAAAPKLAPEPQKSAQVTQKQVEQAFEQLKTKLATPSNALQFELDKQSGDTIVRVLDGETGEVIRQIPSKELLEIARALDKMQGMLLKQQA